MITIIIIIYLSGQKRSDKIIRPKSLVEPWPTWINVCSSKPYGSNKAFCWAKFLLLMKLLRQTKIKVTVWKFRHFSLTSFWPILYTAHNNISIQLTPILFRHASRPMRSKSLLIVRTIFSRRSSTTNKLLIQSILGKVRRWNIFKMILKN